jgi:hypothetical protein
MFLRQSDKEYYHLRNAVSVKIIFVTYLKHMLAISSSSSSSLQTAREIQNQCSVVWGWTLLNGLLGGQKRNTDGYSSPHRSDFSY